MPEPYSDDEDIPEVEAEPVLANPGFVGGLFAGVLIAFLLTYYLIISVHHDWINPVL